MKKPSTDQCAVAAVQIGPYDRTRQDKDREGEFEVSTLHDMTEKKKYVQVTVYDDHGALLEAQFSPGSAARLAMLIQEAVKSATAEEATRT